MTQRTVRVGDIYEDCSYHPVLCTESDGDDIAGISLLDFSEPRSCSIKHCGVQVLDAERVATRLRRRQEWLDALSDFHDNWDSHAFYARIDALDPQRS